TTLRPALRTAAAQLPQLLHCCCSAGTATSQLSQLLRAIAVVELAAAVAVPLLQLWCHFCSCVADLQLRHRFYRRYASQNHATDKGKGTTNAVKVIFYLLLLFFITLICLQQTCTQGAAYITKWQHKKLIR